jgi:hypothetical protein
MSKSGMPTHRTPELLFMKIAGVGGRKKNMNGASMKDAGTGEITSGSSGNLDNLIGKPGRLPGFSISFHLSAGPIHLACGLAILIAAGLKQRT